MTKIGIGDWFLSRSDAFRFMMHKFRDHKIKTENSFTKIRGVHRRYEAQVAELRVRMKRLEDTLDGMKESSKVKFLKRRRA